MNPRLRAGLWVAALLLGFGLALRESIRMALPENDLWWMIPTFETLSQARAGLHEFIFLLSPWPVRLGQPALKMMFFLLQGLGGSQLSQLAVVLAMVHVLNAGLLFWLGRAFGLDKKTCGIASAILLSFSAQFHAYLWPVAFQHLAAVTTLLLILACWITAESPGANFSQKRFWRRATLALTLVGSLQRSLLLLPALLMGDFWLNSENRDVRRRRFETGWPILLVFLGFPLLVLVGPGDDRLTMDLTGVNAPPWLRYVLGVVLGLGALFLLRWVVKLCEQTRWERRLKVAVWLGVGAAAWLLFSRDHRQLFLPYNLLVPFMTCLGAFLHPIRAAFQIDNIQPYYEVSPDISPFLVVLSVVCVGRLLVAPVEGERRLVRFCVLWYLLVVLYPMSHYATYPIRIASRYLVYLAPPFSLVLALAMVRCLEWLGRNTGLRPSVRRQVTEAAVVLLCLANLAGIRVAVWRGRWANNYTTYDDVRIVGLIREDAQARAGGRASVEAVRISGVRPMPYEVRFWRFVPSDPGAYQLFKLLARQESYGLGPEAQVEVSPGPGDSEASYRVEGMRVVRRDGSVVGRFDALWEEGVQGVRDRDWQRAASRLEAAVREKPFLLKFLLPKGSRLEDSRWLVDRQGGLRRWLEQVRNHYDPGIDLIPKVERVGQVVDGELSRYLEALFLLAYAKERLGEREESGLWFRQAGWLEPEVALLQTWIRRDSPVPWDGELEQALIGFCPLDLFVDPLPWRKDDYGRERLLMRLLFGLDIRSRWDRQGVL